MFVRFVSDKGQVIAVGKKTETQSWGNAMRSPRILKTWDVQNFSPEIGRSFAKKQGHKITGLPVAL